MFKLQKIEKDSAHAVLDDFLRSRQFLPVFFYPPYTLITWLTHQNKTLYIADIGNEKNLIVHKEKNNDIRFLFSEPSEALLVQITNHFNPRFIATNELVTVPVHVNNYIENIELLIDVDAVVNLVDKDIEKAYAKCHAKHSHLEVERYGNEHAESVRMFLEEWSHSRTEEKNKFANTANDAHFIELYANTPAAVGLVIKDDAKVVAISFFVPAMDGKAIAVINKCLRGYTQLGVFTFVERAKMMSSSGFKKAYIGAINNDFKKKFIANGETRKIFSREIMRQPDFMAPAAYTLRIF